MVTRGEGKNQKVDVKRWTDIRFYIDGEESGYINYVGQDAGGNKEPLEIGKTYLGSKELFFNGIMSDIRIYNTGIKPANMGADIEGNEDGLIYFWSFAEKEGSVARDEISSNHATIKGAKWVKSPDNLASRWNFFCNGLSFLLEDMSDSRPWGEQQFVLGGLQQKGVLTECFTGIMDELRIWKISRKQEQIQDNMFRRIDEEKEDLVAYYTFHGEPSPEGRLYLQDMSWHGNDLSFGEGASKPISILSTAPVSDDIAQVRPALGGVSTPFHETVHNSPSVEEYGDLQYNNDGETIGVLKRCYVYIKDGQWNLGTGFKVGNLVTEWVSQVQANPQVIGFIEGAPPVPSENLTSTSLVLGEAEDYNGTSSVELEESDEVNFVYSSSRESGFDTSAEIVLQIRAKSRTLAGICVAQEVANVNILGGVKTSLEYSSSGINESSVSYGRNTTKSSRLKLKGSW